MDEYRTPLLVETDPGTNLSSLLADRVAADPDAPFAEHKTADGAWEALSAREVDRRVVAIAKGLVARGTAPGDTVGIMASTSLEWALLDWAVWAAGAVSVPVYETSSAEQVEWIVRDAGVRLLVVEHHDHVAVVDDARELGSAPAPDDVLCLADGALETLEHAGREVDDAVVEERRSAAVGSDLATIIYTSGTTGRPKGVELTHHNFVALARNAAQQFSEIVSAPGARTLLFIPLAHVFARFVHVLVVPAGSVVGYVGDVSTLVEDMQSFRPTYVLAVPRVFEKVYNGADLRSAQDGRQKIFRWAAATATAWSHALDTPHGPGWWLRARHAVADALVLKKIRALLGGQASWAISGGAALGDRLGHFYRGAGIQVLEGYGLTETTAPISVNQPGHVKIGTVGRPLPGCAARVAADGELLLRGPNVFPRYHHAPQATADAFADGWFRTGDLGSIDDDGCLRITGRKKELIVTAGGKNVAPAVLEDRLRSHPLVSQCVVVGDARPFVAVLVTLDPDVLPGWLATKGREAMTVDEAATDPDVVRAVEQAVERTNRAVSRAESIRAVRILPVDLTVDNGYLTPSLKVKRALVLQDFAGVIEEIYAAAPPPHGAHGAPSDPPQEH